MTSTIPLAKPFNQKALEKMGGPYGVSQKHDGVPVKISLDVDYSGLVTKVVVESRQAKPLSSCNVHATILKMGIEQCAYSNLKWPEGRYVIVAEIVHPIIHDFKDLSGIVRSETHEEHKNLHFQVFDFWHSNGPINYDTRMFAAGMLFNRPTMYNRFKLVETSWYDDIDAAVSHAEAIASIEVVEGAIIRSGADRFEPNKRSWGYQKYLKDPVVDLRVHSFEEATSECGEPLGMVGRINCYYNNNIVGVGPGKLTHDQRTSLWNIHGSSIIHSNIIAQVKYKKDDSYKALRQATFQCWRPEKEEPNEAA
jgi:ATP-dependent DNA ligase